jgi:hypothetical protein
MIEKRQAAKGFQSTINNQKSTIASSLLALRAIMTAASREHHSLDRSFANQARLPLAPIHAMLQLEKAFFAIGIHVIRNRRPAKRNRLAQDFFHREEELVQLFMRNIR